MHGLGVQERPEDIPTGELPRTILMAVDRNLCGKIAPGTRVTAVGIFSVFTEGGKEKGASKAARQQIRQPYIRVVGLEEDFEGSSHYAPTFTYAPELYGSLCLTMHRRPAASSLEHWMSQLWKKWLFLQVIA